MEDTLTAEDVSNLTSAMKTFTKQLEKVNSSLLKGKNTLKGSSDIQKDMNDMLEDQEKAHTKLGKALKDETSILSQAKDAVGDILKDATKISGVLTGAGIVAFSVDLVKSSIDLDNRMTALSARMGKMVSKKQLTGAVNNLQKDLGATYEDALAITTTLAENKYVDNIEEAAKGANLFARATGVSNTEVTAMTTELSKGAFMSTKSINSMYAGMMKVQQQIGLSTAGMQAVTAQVQKTAVSMSAFGKSSEDIKKMANQTTALVAGLEKVGVSAGTAAELVDKLTDPDRIEENIGLYAQLGISMEDALSGNALDGMDSKLKEMSQRIVDMGPIAGANFAKSMGMSYKQATQMAKMEGGEADKVADAAMTSEDEAMDTMKKLEKETEGFGKQMETWKNKLEGALRSLPAILLVVGGLAIAALGKKIKAKITEFSQSKQYSPITEAIGSSIAAGFNKGKDLAAKKIQETGMTLKRTITNAYDISAVGKFFSSTDKYYSNIIAKASKKSFADAFYDSSLKNKKDALSAKIEADNAKLAELRKQFNELVKSENQITDSSSIAQVAAKASNETAGDDNIYKKKALLAIQEQLKNITNEKTVAEAKQEKVTMGKNKKELNLIKAIEKAQEDLNKTQSHYDTFASQKGEAEKKVNDLKTQEEIQKNILKNIKGNGPAEQKAREEIKQKLILIQAEKKANEDVLKIAEMKAKKIGEEVDKKKRALHDSEVELKNERSKLNIWQTLVKATGVFAGNLEEAAKQKIANIGFIKDARQAYSNNMVPGSSKGGAVMKAIGAGAKSVGKSAGKATLKAIGGIAKTLGPMAIVMKLLGKVMQKVQPKLEAFFDGVMSYLEPVLDTLMGALMPAMTSIVKGLLPPMLKILAYTLKAVGIILWPLKEMIKLIGKIPGVSGVSKGVLDVIDAFTGSQMTDSLIAAAESMEKGGNDFSKVVKKEEKNQEDQAALIKANGADLVQVKEATVSNSANAQSSSTTQTTTESGSAESQLKAMEEKKLKKLDKTFKENMQVSTKDIVDLLKELRDEFREFTKQKVQSAFSGNAAIENLSSDEIGSTH